MAGLRLCTVTMIYKIVLNGIHEVQLGFTLKIGILLKNDKMRRA